MKSKFLKWVFMASALFTMNVAIAQEAGSQRPKLTPEQKSERMTSHLKERLSLTDDQTEKVKAIYLAHAQQMSDGKGSKKTSRDDLEKSLAGVLTPEQLEKFKSFKAERKDKMKAHRADDNNNNQDQEAPAEQK
jgi:protein CpxP